MEAWALAVVLSSSLLLVGHAAPVRLQSSLNINPSDPVSATPADLVNDPQGRGHLLARLGAPAINYQAQYPYMFPPGIYDVPPNVDPGNGIPAGGSGATYGSWQVVGNAGALAVHAIPFTNDLILFMSRPNNRNGSGDDPYLTVQTVNDGIQTEIAALYDTNGKGIIVGGDDLNLNPPFLTNGIQAVRVFDPVTREIELVATLQRGSWYVSVMTLSDGNLLILGGVQQEAGGFAGMPAPSTNMHPITTCSPNTGGSIADPSYDNPSFSIFNTKDYTNSAPLTLTILLQSWPVNSYPYAFLMPSGSALIIAGSLMDALFLTADGATRDNAIGPLSSLPVPVNYPQYNSATLLPLQGPHYATRVLLAGGSGEYCSNSMTPAGQTSYLIDVSPGADHTIQEESLAFPRIMGDLTLLPDGTVFLCNGAQVGIAGGSGPNGAAATNGTTVSELYNPAAPLGSRWTTVADSGIYRLYHSWSLLKSDATVIVGGSEVTAEHRVQIWTPPYLLNGKPRPTISGAPSTLSYASSFSFGFSGVSTVDRVVINRVVSATHGNHFDQRQVVLDCSASSGNSIACTGPPNSSIAPPGQYMLFAVSGGVPSIAPYVSLQTDSLKSGLLDHLGLGKLKHLADEAFAG